MKEPLVEECNSIDVPVCPWCFSPNDENIDATQEKYDITCPHCNESYEVYVMVQCTTYPIESMEN